MTKLIIAVALLLASGSLFAQADGDSQKVVLVTGATSGIGLKITEHLSAGGIHVYAGARKAEDMERLDAMTNVTAVRLDVTSDDDIAAALVKLSADERGLWGIVNNAGVVNIGPLIEQSEDDIRFLFDVNVFGPYRITRAFAPLVIESEGRIVNISSISGVLSGTFFGAYSMSKHALEAYTDSLAAEMERLGVHVAAVEPGNYSSNIGKNMLERMQARGYDVENSRFAADLTRMLEGFSDYEQPGEFNPEPDDVARAVEHALFADEPRDHYMVVPYERQAEITLNKLLEELARFNEGHRYSYDRDALVEMLDAALEGAAGPRDLP